MNKLGNYVKAWIDPVAPHSLHRNVGAVTSGTFQATTNIDKLHMLTSGSDLLILRGTGTSVTATSGQVWLASYGPYFFRPKTGAESLGYAALDGSTTFSTASKAVTIGVVEP